MREDVDLLMADRAGRADQGHEPWQHFLQQVIANRFFMVQAFMSANIT